MKRSGKVQKLRVLRPGAAAPGGPFVLAVPGQMVPVQDFDLPAGVTGAARRRVALAAYGDRTGVSADALVAVPLGAAPGWTRAAVCDRAVLRRWCEDPLARDRACRAVLPDYLTLPLPEGRIAVQVVGDHVLMRLSADDGISLPVTLAPALLGRLLEDHPQRRVLALGPLPEGVRAALVSGGLSVETRPEETPPMMEATAPLPDLRKALESDAARPATGLWLAAACLALAGFGLWTGALWLEARKLDAASAAIRAETVALARSGPIPEGPILDLPLQVNRALEARRALGADTAPEASALLSRVTLVAFGKGLSVERLELAPDGGAALQVAARDYAAIDALLRDFAEAGLTATARDSRVRPEGGVAARIELREAGDE